MEGTRVSILGVATERLPIYLFIFALCVAGLLAYAVAVRWDSIGQIVRYFFELLREYASGLIIVLVAVEGVVMGLNEIRTRQKIAEAIQEERRRGNQEARQEGRQEGRQEARQEAIKILEQAGMSDSARLLREHGSDG